MDIVKIAAMLLPEFAQPRFEVDQFDTLRKAVMQRFDMRMMQTVTTNKARLHTMQQRLFDARALCMREQMPRHARTRNTMPETRRMAFGRMMKVQPQRNEFAHDVNRDQVTDVVCTTAAFLRRARRKAGMSARRMPSGRIRCFDCPTRWAR
jgi:hypothetical protein